ncbi:MAG: hypothetical protein HY721_03275, partial [Planctomycetes bacterium]|nr:hypothetical protein [Planctomycetota bacterium]
KHVAAVLYGVGARLDTRPELLFVLRGVNHTELITEAAGAALVGEDAGAAAAMGRDEMSKLFGIELESEHAAAASAGERTPAAPVRKKAGRRPNDGPRGGYYSKLESLDARLPRLREHFVQEDMLTNAGYRALFSVPGKVATLELKRLAERRILIRRGKKRGAHYLAGVEMW